MAVMPMMPFSGVRISWDMRERNSLFALLASRAWESACSARSRSSASSRSFLRVRR